MALAEVNFDGLIGPSHNYAGLSLGNLASAKNAGGVSFPRAAALQGLEKMRANLGLGLVQGVFLPHARPNRTWLATLPTTTENARPMLLANALSASPMWAANAATVSPAPDTGDSKCHLSVANLMTMPHRSHEWPETLAQFRTIFANPQFVVHPPVPTPFGDEGAANHMRLCKDHASPGIEIFVFGQAGGPYPARQHIEASRAVSRQHNLAEDRALFVQQSPEAIAAGAFHNDVVAVANETVLFAHEQAFADRDRFYTALHEAFPDLCLIEVPASAISLEDAIQSYLFNAQVVTQADGTMTLILPTEAQQNERVWTWLQAMIAGNGPIRTLLPVDVRQSMANGGGPACLRLRVVCDPTLVDARFLLDDGKIDALAEIVRTYWPEEIAANDLATPSLWSTIESARSALLAHLGVPELVSV